MEILAGKKTTMYRCNRGIFPKYKIVIGESMNSGIYFKRSRLDCEMICRPKTGILPPATITHHKSLIRVKIKVIEKKQHQKQL